MHRLAVLATLAAFVCGAGAQEVPKPPALQKEHEWLQQFVGEWEGGPRCAWSRAIRPVRSREEWTGYVGVQVDAFEVRAEAELDRLELGQLREDAMVPGRAGDLLRIGQEPALAVRDGAADPGRVHTEGRMAREKEIYLGLSERWRNIPKPTIAQVQGTGATTPLDGQIVNVEGDQSIPRRHQLASFAIPEIEDPLDHLVLGWIEHARGRTLLKQNLDLLFRDGRVAGVSHTDKSQD